MPREKLTEAQSMSSELQRAARTAWAAMDEDRSKLQRMVDQMAGDNRGPMAPGVALDFVQEATGERDDAVTALVHAGADWLDTQTRPSEWGELGDACHADALVVALYIRAESFALAYAFLSHIEERCGFAAHPMATSQEKRTAAAWVRWADKARHVIDRCKAIVEAAYPESPAGAA